MLTTVRPTFWPLLRVAGGLILRIFLRRISVRAEHPVPETGPVIFASNHPNGLLDPVAVGRLTSRPLCYLAKSGLFGFPPLGAFLRRCGAIPVYRRMDDPAEMHRNRETFELCTRVLEEGGAIGIFPEGTSHPDPQLRRLKTGAARIALEAEARNSFRLGVRIVPVGLTFPERSRFRSVLTIWAGEPLSLDGFRKRYAENPEETVREVIRCLEERLKKRMLHLDRAELADIVEAVREIYARDLAEERQKRRGELPEPADEFLVERGIIDAIHFFWREDPRTFRRIEGRILRYRVRLGRLRIREEALRDAQAMARPARRSFIGGGWPKWGMELAFWAALGLPAALYGTINSLLPYLVTVWLGRRVSQGPADFAQKKILVGAFAFAAFFLAQSFFCFWWLGLWPAVLYAISLPVSGFFAVKFWRQARAVSRRLWLGTLGLRRPAVVRRLLLDRLRLVHDLDRLRDRYLEEAGRGAKKQAL